MSSNYPEGLSGEALCYMEGCVGSVHCLRCGKTNYGYMGYLGAIARWAKAWNVTPDEAEKRFIAKAESSPPRRTA